ncbi:MAG: NADH-quinone oxidoreductase subunit NuoE [Phycisphaerae bacterium]|nr:NADH-quinone oxidoreductase subunit NuoE [Phycisphaerae bacterium]
MVQPDIQSILEQYPQPKRENLIPILQAVQECCGYLSQESMIQIGNRLKLPVSKVYGVATFYNQFRFQPRGKVHCQVCRGTACHVKGSAKVLEALKQTLKIEPGQTTRDGMFSLEVVACIGACGLAPVVAINGEFHAGVTPDSIRKIIKSYAKKGGDNGGVE